MFGSIFAIDLCNGLQAVSRLSPGKYQDFSIANLLSPGADNQGLACGLLTDLLLITSNIGCANLLFQSNLNTIVLAVPLPERSGINLDDSVLDKSLGSDLHR